MKKVILAAVFMAGAYVASAQTKQGQWMVGGNAGFNSSKTGSSDAGKVTSFQLKPDAGYFFIDNLAAGVHFNYSSDKVKSEDKATTTFLAGPFVRYYVLPHATNLNVFVDGTYQWGSEGQATKYSVNGFEFKAGPAFFLNPHVALEASINYSSYKVEYATNRTNTFGINFGFQIHLGSAKK